MVYLRSSGERVELRATIGDAALIWTRGDGKSFIGGREDLMADGGSDEIEETIKKIEETEREKECQSLQYT